MNVSHLTRSPGRANTLSNDGKRYLKYRFQQRRAATACDTVLRGMSTSTSKGELCFTRGTHIHPNQAIVLLLTPPQGRSDETDYMLRMLKKTAVLNVRTNGEPLKLRRHRSTRYIVYLVPTW